MAKKGRKANGQFAKRYHSAHTAMTRQAPRYSKPVVVTRTRTVKVKAKRRGRRKGGGAGNSPSVPMLVGAAAALAYIGADQKADTLAAKIMANVQKLPGAKTVGTEGAIGLVALGVNHFVYRNRFIKAVGLVGCAFGVATVVRRVVLGGEVYVGDDDVGGGEGFVSDVEG